MNETSNLVRDVYNVKNVEINDKIKEIKENISCYFTLNIWGFNWMSNLLKEMKIDSSSHGHRKRALNLIIISLE